MVKEPVGKIMVEGVIISAVLSKLRIRKSQVAAFRELSCACVCVARKIILYNGR